MIASGEMELIVRPEVAARFTVGAELEVFDDTHEGGGCMVLGHITAITDNGDGTSTIRLAC